MELYYKILTVILSFIEVDKIFLNFYIFELVLAYYRFVEYTKWFIPLHGLVFYSYF